MQALPQSVHTAVHAATGAHTQLGLHAQCVVLLNDKHRSSADVRSLTSRGYVQCVACTWLHAQSELQTCAGCKHAHAAQPDPQHVHVWVLQDTGPQTAG